MPSRQPTPMPWPSPLAIRAPGTNLDRLAPLHRCRATVLDTTGAGDTFTGFFLAGLLAMDAPVEHFIEPVLPRPLALSARGCNVYPSLHEVLARAAADAE